jgi:hypothetical protein
MTIRTLALAVLLAGTARAECKGGAPTLAGARAKVGLYAESGKFEREVEGSTLVADAAVLDCNEDLGLVKVRLKDGKEAWVDRAEVTLKLAKGDAPRPCVAGAAARRHDTVEPVVAGLGGDDCVPKPAPKK